MTLFVEVAFPLPLDQTFHYVVPPELADRAAPGARIRAPLGARNLAGFIVAVSDVPPSGRYSLKEIREVLDASPVLSRGALAFALRLSNHHRSPLGEFLQAMLPPSLELNPATKIRLTGAGAEAKEAQRLRGAEKSIADILGSGMVSMLTLKRRSGVRSVEAAVRRMAVKGLIEAREAEPVAKRRPRSALAVPLPPSQLELDFSSEPGSAALLAPVFGAINAGGFATFYFEGPREARWSAYSLMIRDVRARGRQVLFLVPELAQAESFHALIGSRLGISAALFHGGVPLGRRERIWEGLRAGGTGIAIGPRSVLFSPVERPGLVIVDDEADEAYFQAESPSYDARTAARLRAEDAGAVLLFGSEFPSVEAYEKAAAAGYLSRLPGGEPAKQAAIIDDTREKGLLAGPLLEGIRSALDARERGLIFLNRRGYASFLFCPRCGYIPRCSRCRTPLAYSKKEASLGCRYCRIRVPASSACPECGSPVLEPRGAGVEAVEEELKRRFPSARIAVFDSDRIRSRSAREEALAGFATGRIDLLIGTQLLAHASPPHVPFVGVLHPEALLGSADFRAAQRTLLTARRMLGFVASGGRGSAVIQTAFPDHHSVRAAACGDYRLFFEPEIRLRRALNLPPFTALAEVSFWGGTARVLAVRARDFVGRARRFRPAVEVLGPALSAAPSPRGGRGIQVVVRADTQETLDACLEGCLKPVPGRRSVVRSD
jgi:primosomal protein N' (replication factor Y)